MAVKSLAQDKMPNVDHQTSQFAQILVCPNEFLFGQNDSNQQPILFWLNKFGQLAILPNGLKKLCVFMFSTCKFSQKIARFFYWVLAT
jgi:hypothetical protein